MVLTCIFLVKRMCPTLWQQFVVVGHLVNVPTARTTWPRVSRSGRAELQRRPQAPRPAAIAEEWADEYDEGTERLLLAIGGKAAENAA